MLHRSINRNGYLKIMKRLVVCGGSGAGKTTIANRLQDGKNFAILDIPGSENSMADLASAALNSDLAVVVIDARFGLSDDIFRQCLALKVLGVSRAICVVSKMDLVEFSQDIFDEIDEKISARGEALGLEIGSGVPSGIGNTDNDDGLTWYQGPSLAALTEQGAGDSPASSGPFRFLVEGIDGDTVTGMVVGGSVNKGEGIVALPTAGTGKIKNLITGNDRTTLEIESHLDVSTGDIICKIDDRAQLSDQFRINLLWQDEAPLLPSRPYLLKMGERVVAASITDIRHIVNSQTLEQDAAKIMRLNETGACNLAVAGPIPYDPFEENRITGCFTLLDRESHQTVATGTIQYGLYRADNIHWQALGIDKAARSNMKEQKPAVLWFTGLSASGKSTIANLVEQKLHEAGRHTYTLDGDNVRHGLNKNLGFTDADRVENIRRVAETSKLMIDAGLICLVSFISPFRAERRMARELMEDGEFIEVFVDAPLEVCEARDPKGLYKKARAGEIKNFTGFDSPYEAPEHAEIVIPTAEMNPDEAAENIIGYLRGQRLVGQ